MTRTRLAGHPRGFGLAAFLLALFLAAVLPAFARQFVIQEFSAEIMVQENGVLDVTETISPRFIGAWNGMYRTIPVEYVTPQGFNYELLLDVLSVTDASGAKLKYESSRERHYLKLKIYVPGAQDAMRTVVIHYRVYDGLKFFEDHDELYWNITGDEWEGAVQAASAKIFLPQGVTGVRATTFTGAYGSREQDAEAEISGPFVEVRLRRSLGFRQGLTAVVGWDKGFVHEPTVADKLYLFVRSNWPLVLPLLVFGVVFWLWYTRGRDPRLRPIAAQYAPPEELTPGEAGTLVDNQAAMRDVTATLVDLSVRGFILIEEEKKEHMMGLWSDKEYVFHLRKKREEWTGLKPHEVELLDGVFSAGTDESVELSELQNKFYKNIPLIRDRIFESLVKKGYYLHRPDKVRQAYLVAALVIGILSVAFGGGLSAALGMAPLPFILAGIATAAIIF